MCHKGLCQNRQLRAQTDNMPVDGLRVRSGRKRGPYSAEASSGRLARPVVWVVPVPNFRPFGLTRFPDASLGGCALRMPGYPRFARRRTPLASAAGPAQPAKFGTGTANNGLSQSRFCSGRRAPLALAAGPAQAARFGTGTANNGLSQSRSCWASRKWGTRPNRETARPSPARAPAKHGEIPRGADRSVFGGHAVGGPAVGGQERVVGQQDRGGRLWAGFLQSVETTLSSLRLRALGRDTTATKRPQGRNQRQGSIVSVLHTDHSNASTAGWCDGALSPESPTPPSQAGWRRGRASRHSPFRLARGQGVRANYDRWPLAFRRRLVNSATVIRSGLLPRRAWSRSTCENAPPNCSSISMRTSRMSISGKHTIA